MEIQQNRLDAAITKKIEAMQKLADWQKQADTQTKARAEDLSNEAEELKKKLQQLEEKNDQVTMQADKKYAPSFLAAMTWDSVPEDITDEQVEAVLYYTTTREPEEILSRFEPEFINKWNDFARQNQPRMQRLTREMSFYLESIQDPEAMKLAEDLARQTEELQEKQMSFSVLQQIQPRVSQPGVTALAIVRDAPAQKGEPWTIALIAVKIDNDYKVSQAESLPYAVTGSLHILENGRVPGLTQAFNAPSFSVGAGQALEPFVHSYTPQSDAAAVTVSLVGQMILAGQIRPMMLQVPLIDKGSPPLPPPGQAGGPQIKLRLM